MTETEIKSIIDKDTYMTLLSMFNWTSSKEQTNSYYTAPNNALKKSHGITFRVRTIDNTSKIQIKKHLIGGSALQKSEESEYDVEGIPKGFDEETVKHLTGISTPVFLIGSLTTLRNSLMYCDGVMICLDKSEYLGVTDYEIEIEYTNPIPDSLINALSDVGVKFDSPCVGKFSRFISRLNSKDYAFSEMK